ncbi:PTS galactitol transporter subunit IIB [Ruoffia tabacinasalis]|uniref:PTS galactitol transporter subunit IIB n=1 Tax=Ruoffia tabacinasalis TaxID=87458 RepID=A0A5R9DSN1_9LACT|nr:PTS sugar transporter subunit IIB [Ruoffia tabacinasalis]TLQ39069.1 PTS galactitol transporter subunit IIB [Ruoffia tabacinasalis]
MKKILVACGSGIATSTAVNNKIKNILDSNGYKGEYEINQIKVTEAPRLSPKYDFLISTTQEPAGLECEYVSAVPFLTGVNIQKATDEILELMKK